MRISKLMVLWVLCGQVATVEALASGLEGWEMASRRSHAGRPIAVYVEASQTPGTPAFRIETVFDVEPRRAAQTLMREMADTDEPSSSGETRKLISRTEREALVHTYVDLPLFFSDRELAVRIRHSEDPATGVHRIDWVDDNDVLPPVVDKDVLRLETTGYWEFRPVGAGRTEATYMTRAEIGGSLPSAVSHRLMKSQAIDAVERLQGLLEQPVLTHVAAPPPE